MFRFFVLLLFISFPKFSTSNQNCEEGWEYFDGKCYFFRTGDSLTWSLAQQFCQENGGNLPLPRDKVENTGMNAVIW